MKGNSATIKKSNFFIFVFKFPLTSSCMSNELPILRLTFVIHLMDAHLIIELIMSDAFLPSLASKYKNLDFLVWSSPCHPEDQLWPPLPVANLQPNLLSKYFECPSCKGFHLVMVIVFIIWNERNCTFMCTIIVNNFVLDTKGIYCNTGIVVRVPQCCWFLGVLHFHISLIIFNRYNIIYT